jgi:hypothetical protein
MKSKTNKKGRVGCPKHMANNWSGLPYYYCKRKEGSWMKMDIWMDE